MELKLLINVLFYLLLNQNVEAGNRENRRSLGLPQSIGPNSMNNPQFVDTNPFNITSGLGFNQTGNGLGPNGPQIGNFTTGFNGGGQPFDWHSQLEASLNTPLNSLKGLEPYQSQIQTLVTSSSSITKSQSSSISVSSSTSDNNGGLQSCGAQEYITLSATSLTALSSFYTKLESFESVCSQNGLQKSGQLVQKFKSSVSSTMLSVVQLSATNEVTTCKIQPSQCQPGTQVQNSINQFSQSVTEIEQSISTEIQSLNGNGGCKPPISNGLQNGFLGSNNSMVSDGLMGTFPTGNNYSAAGNSLQRRGDFNQTGNPTNPLGNGYNMTSSLGDGRGLGFSPGDSSKQYSGNQGSPSYTITTNTTSSKSFEKSKSQKSTFTTSTQYGNSKECGTDVIQKFSECKQVYSTVKQICAGLINSQPSKGPTGIYIGNSNSQTVNINYNTVLNTNSQTIHKFIKTVNGGKVEDNSNNQNYPSNGNQYPSGNSNYPSNGNQYPSGNPNYPSNGNQYPDNSNYPNNGNQYPSDNSNYPSNGNQYPSGNSNYPSNGNQYPSDNSNYPNNGGGSGYPTVPNGGSEYPSGGSGGSSYPSNTTEYPSGGSTSGYPSQPQQQPNNPTDTSGYPANTSGYPTQNSGYPADTSGYPTENSGNPTNSSSYPTGGSGYPSGGQTPEHTSGSGYPSGGDTSSQCVCPGDKSHSLRIRSLEDQLASIHRVMKKRGLSEL
ncbi:hypothetical protein BY996DRAFT_6419803 [Phakopsora pachyrhizi]|nr:hypothetical protein BY996DRAFT_6419803 [Phakopsora pachyrhizi]